MSSSHSKRNVGLPKWPMEVSKRNAGGERGDCMAILAVLFIVARGFVQDSKNSARFI